MMKNILNDLTAHISNLEHEIETLKAENAALKTQLADISIKNVEIMNLKKKVEVLYQIKYLVEGIDFT